MNMTGTRIRSFTLNSALQTLLFIVLLVQGIGVSSAHHVLGRPSYSLNEDSNTPPSMNLETRVGDYFITAMIYPAYPKPNQPGRINLYATHLDSGEPLDAAITFKVRENSWLVERQQKLGAQVLDDNVYRQAFVFQHQGDYIITAEFKVDGETYSIDFPLQVGTGHGYGWLSISITGLILLLIVVSIVKRKSLMRIRLQTGRDEQR